MNRAIADRVNMLPLYFSTRRMARVLGIVFVLAAAIGWVAAGYDLGELRAIHGGAALAPAAVLAHDAGGRADRGRADRVRGARSRRCSCRGSIKRAPTCARSARAGCASAASGPTSASRSRCSTPTAPTRS